MPIIEIVPAERIRHHDNFIKLSLELDKLRASIKLNNAVNHKSHLLKVKSKFILHIKLDDPNINNTKRVNLMKFIFKLISVLWYL